MKFKLGFTLLALCMLIVTACSSSTNSEAKKRRSREARNFFLVDRSGEEDGLKALIQLFEEENKDIPIENAAVAGGAGTKMQRLS
ncbi:hypothetical protein BsIDN1_63270 [Bacillus safensis]|uniref:PBP domain-containing protein n=1 Tax=Bacillus safensis TaxID=561879 RepID=A0A5S9MLA9_BACIA|nr:hypothetical protein BsIDN1_63270 [Bacillus safensis]